MCCFVVPIKLRLKIFFYSFRDLLQQQNNDESVAAKETNVPEAVSNEKGNQDEKSDQFVVTQEYIQDSMSFISYGV